MSVGKVEIQGTLHTGLVSQDYRKELQEFIKSCDKEAVIVDTFDICDHPELLEKDDEIRHVFEYNVQKAVESDIVVAFVPSASMGTAVEICSAWKAGKTVYTISPLKENWTIRLYSTQVFPTMEEFKTFYSNLLSSSQPPQITETEKSS
eukprot:MONOS_3031.1-p1 / transcript=MONOS_3031.1 / gene=MONOS_3031 / organism=Monocercomonoides_exilis_PA203 / gene_product=unspecified product / transcript_product=unspecified product / location=Mono_scaffold00067:72968-73768(+) / protein_length=148 / sequence_SO=supercontig / SO=protein_coding / is_pseudo=false